MVEVKLEPAPVEEVAKVQIHLYTWERILYTCTPEGSYYTPVHLRAHIIHLYTCELILYTCTPVSSYYTPVHLSAHIVHL